MKKHYVGITGVTTRKEARFVLNAFSRAGFSMGRRHVPMVGVLISPRNLDPEWSSSRYPKLDTFPSIIKECAGKCFLTLHVDAKSTSNWEEDFCKLLDQLPIDDVDGFQINVMHPDMAQINDIRKKYPGKQIIFQYSKDFMKLDEISAMEDLSTYAASIDRVLIDPSRGRGEAIDLELAMKHYRAIRRSFDLDVGFAGGFSPENIEGIVESFVEQIGGEFSIDVETGVRNGKDELEIAFVVEYLKMANSGLFMMNSQQNI